MTCGFILTATLKAFCKWRAKSTGNIFPWPLIHIYKSVINASLIKALLLKKHILKWSCGLLCLIDAFSHGQSHRGWSEPQGRGSCRPEGRLSEEQRRSPGWNAAFCGRLPAHTVARAVLQTHVFTSSQRAETEGEVRIPNSRLNMQKDTGWMLYEWKRWSCLVSDQ